MTREEVIEYWEQFNAEIDDLYDACSDEDRDVLVKQREIVEYTISALRQQEPNDWICKLKCTALMDEGMCSHGGICCMYEEQRAIKENQPLTLDELRQMDGEPVWVVYDEDAGMWALVEVCEESIFLTNNLGGRTEYAADVELEDDGFTVYRQKPEEDDHG